MPTEIHNLRYAAHLPLAGIGEAGQAKIRDSHVALIGVGGLGCPAAQYLVSSGVGELTLCDFDHVTESNLSRQILYRVSDLGRLKVEVAAQQLQSLNPETNINIQAKRMADQDMQLLFSSCDFVIDASDNYGTRLAVNRSCLELGIPWLMASCIRLEGQLMLLRPDLADQPCYLCAYGVAPDTLEDCPGAGIFAPVAGVVGTSAAYFALASLTGLPAPNGLHLFDATHWSWQSLRVSKNPACKECAAIQY